MTPEQQAIFDAAIAANSSTLDGYDAAIHEPVFVGESLRGYQAKSNPEPVKPELILASVTDLATGQAISPQEPGNLISMKAGTTCRFRVEQQMNGEVISQVPDGQGGYVPNNAEFALPLAGLLGTAPRIIDIAFVGGIAEFDVTWKTPGLWEVTVAEVNMDIADPAQHFAFAGCRIKVRE
ncbi:hypothetical protein [Bowmanella dokdonensis]|uniref:Uncharacterized protein n=1 Tax=Bowmanella dokdonensis TaxID=751969 RepID=A0A939IQ93_9ALTE|nr:hypothetical protein [Bowmanella dokdonensis]MBN7824789.1 hypothetical protein [Bowmanella dokdonensis]